MSCLGATGDNRITCQRSGTTLELRILRGGTDKVAAEILDATRRGVVNRIDAVVAGWHALIG